MKKILLLFISIITLSSCDSDDDKMRNYPITISSSGFISSSDNVDGIYKNAFGATARSQGNNPVSGFVRFTLKEFGEIDSEVKALNYIESENYSNNVFTIEVEANKRLDNSYITKVEFIRANK